MNAYSYDMENQNLASYLKSNSIEHKVNGKGWLSVSGSLDLEGTSITELPDNLSVGGFLDLEGTSITKLPDNLSVGGSLDLRGTGITELPDNLSVSGPLDLEGTSITELPDNLSVGGYLNLEGTGITKLPDNLSVGGYLYLRGTGITELPDNLSVGGSLYCNIKVITNVGYKENCGRCERTLIAFVNNHEPVIQAGCFLGSYEKFCRAVDESYSGSDAEKYKADAQYCVDELISKLGGAI